MTHEHNGICHALAAMCEEFGVGCVVQVGAWDGYEIAKIQEITDCHAVAIDGDDRHPQPFDNIEYHTIVIGATDCVTRFHKVTTPGLSTCLQLHKDDKQYTNVEQQRLDTFCKERNIFPDALIIDTEGTTMDVLEGCGKLLDDIRLIYAECQNRSDKRPGIRYLDEVDAFLVERGFEQREGPPSYDCGGQGNYTWIRK